MLHTKAIGTVGELMVAAELVSLGYAVFTELGDLSPIDLITVKDSKLTRIQVKTQKSTSRGTISVPRKSKGPGYEYSYSSTDIDVVAVYAMDRKEVFYVSIEELSTKTTGLTLRIDPPTNGQVIGVNLAENYRSFENAQCGPIAQ